MQFTLKIKLTPGYTRIERNKRKHFKEAKLNAIQNPNVQMKLTPNATRAQTKQQQHSLPKCTASQKLNKLNLNTVFISWTDDCAMYSVNLHTKLFVITLDKSFFDKIRAFHHFVCGAQSSLYTHRTWPSFSFTLCMYVKFCYNFNSRIQNISLLFCDELLS